MLFRSQTYVQYKGKRHVQVAFTKILIPKTAGALHYDPASVTASVAASVSGMGFFQRRADYKTFIVKSKPVDFDIKPLPSQDRPDNFSGLVGSYMISASATPVKVNIGDPIELTINVAGSQYLAPVQMPNLEAVKECQENFKLSAEQNLPEIKDNIKTFKTTIRAKSADVNRIPPIPLSFFDIEKGQYVTRYSDPIDIDVAATEIVTTADAVGNTYVPVSRQVEAVKQGISANYDSLSALENEQFKISAVMLAPVYLSLWSVPLAIFALSVFYKLVTFKSPARIRAKRRKNARGSSISIIKGIRPDDAKAHELLISALRKYIGDRFDRSANSLTADDCYDIIVSNTNASDIADEYRHIMWFCEAGTYAPETAKIDKEKIQQSMTLIKQIDGKIRK